LSWTPDAIVLIFLKLTFSKLSNRQIEDKAGRIEKLLGEIYVLVS
jgi:hypothetical protein